MEECTVTRWVVGEDGVWRWGKWSVSPSDDSWEVSGPGVEEGRAVESLEDGKLWAAVADAMQRVMPERWAA